MSEAQPELRQVCVMNSLPDLKLSVSIVHNGSQNVLALCSGGYEDGRSNAGADALLLTPRDFATLIELLAGDRRKAKRDDLTVSFMETAPMKNGGERVTLGIRVERPGIAVMVPIEAVPQVMMGLHAGAIWLLSGGNARVRLSSTRPLAREPEPSSTAEPDQPVGA